MEIYEIITLALLGLIFFEVTLLLLQKLKAASLKRHPGGILIDTSVLIDGRIALIAKTGFITSSLVVPRSVIGELQLLADSADQDKRSKARRGLDVVMELQAMPEVEVSLLQDSIRANEGVDERLLALAKKNAMALMTLDYNLSKVAVVENIKVMNINDLAQTVRMAYLPGERIELEIVQKGQEASQGVGYLADGTMVVVEQAGKLISKRVEIEIVRVLQTSAGRMMFAKLMNQKSNLGFSKPSSKSHKNTSKPSLKQVTHSEKHQTNIKPASLNDAEANLVRLANSD